jgi:putative ABC transport system permease protein
MLRRFIARTTAFLSPGAAEREMTREVAAHLALIEEDYRRRGMSESDARRAATQAMGGIDKAKEIHRDQRSFPWLEDFRRDVPYALRAWRRHPGFTVAAVLTIGLGVGASTAIFSVINTILFRPLPYRNADRLVQIAENVVRSGPQGTSHSRRFGLTQAEFLEWRARATSYEHLAGVVNLMSGILQTAEGPIPAPRAIVSPAMFEMLGVPAQLGRTLLPEDERPNAAAAVVSAAAWRRLFGSDPAVLGRRITLNDASFTIVGVMPPGFDYPEGATMFWTALTPRPGSGTNAFGNAIATLKLGVSLEVATEEANTIGSALRVPQTTFGYGAGGGPPPAAPATATLGGHLRNEVDLANRPRFEILRVKDLIVNQIRPQLRVLAVAVSVVLLIACANVANLLLVRGSARQREIGVRLAIGAGRGRIVRQILTESGLLAIAGGIVGVAIAAGAVRLVEILATVDTPRLFQLSINLGSGSLLPRTSELGVDGTMLVLALLIALVAGLAFGLAPAVHLSTSNVAKAIATGGSRSDGSQATGGALRSLLVVTQVTLAAALLVGAGLLVHSFAKLQSVDLGFDPRTVLTFQLVLPPPPPPGERQQTIIERVVERLQSDPRVVSAGYTNIAPFLALTEIGGLFVPPGFTREQMLADPRRPQTRIMNHTYLQTIGSQLLDGRWLSESDGASQPSVMVVNRSLAQRYFPGRSPVNQLVRVFRSPDYVEDWRIVGVIDDVMQARLDEEPFPIVMVDLRQVLAARQRMPKELQLGQGLPGFSTFAVRTRGDWEPIAADLRTIVRDVDPAVGVGSIADVESLRYGSLVRPRFYAVLVGIFAAIAGTIAGVGIYAVLAFTVVQRTHEIGVRMALGARRLAVLRELLRHGVLLTLLGVALGLTAAAGMARYLSTMLFGLTALDVSTYVGVAFALLVVAALASLVPAHRVTTVDPVIALRCE